MSYFMWGLQALSGSRSMKKGLKKNHKTHSILLFSSTICLCSSMVYCTEKFDGCKSTYTNFWSGKKSWPFNLPSGRISPPFVTPLTGDKNSWEALSIAIKIHLCQMKRVEGHPCITQTITYYSKFWTPSTFF